jgi:hypothetical protein
MPTCADSFSSIRKLADSRRRIYRDSARKYIPARGPRCGHAGRLARGTFDAPLNMSSSHGQVAAQLFFQGEGHTIVI